MPSNFLHFCTGLYCTDGWREQSVVIFFNHRSIVRGSSSYNLTMTRAFYRLEYFIKFCFYMCGVPVRSDQPWKINAWKYKKIQNNNSLCLFPSLSLTHTVRNAYPFYVLILFSLVRPYIVLSHPFLIIFYISTWSSPSIVTTHWHL